MSQWTSASRSRRFVDLLHVANEGECLQLFRLNHGEHYRVWRVVILSREPSPEVRNHRLGLFDVAVGMKAIPAYKFFKHFLSGSSRILLIHIFM